MHPGRFSVVGTTEGDTASLLWRVVDDAGSVVARGTAYPGATAGRGQFVIGVEVPEGSYEVLLRSSEPSSGTSGEPSCWAVRLPISVVPESTGPTWVSGASGEGVATGAFEAWRGSPVAIAGTWADNNWGQVNLPQLRPGGEYDDWTGDLEIAVGAIGPGETWAAAAQGAYDGRWRQSLQEIGRLWGDRPGAVHLRFAHEFNGDWFPWSVTAASRDDFITAWRRYHALQQRYLPDAALVFAPNTQTAVGNDLDWRTAFPGVEHVDVLALSYFNAYPGAQTAEEFEALSLAYDRHGAPQGIRRFQEFAADVGLPLAVSEWGIHVDFGDSAVYMQQMDQFFRAHAGTGPGTIRYEILYNVVNPGNRFALMPETNAPAAAKAYSRLW
jgi:hypothetical protein